MHREGLIEAISAATDIKKEAVRLMLDQFEKEVIQAVAGGGTVQIWRFGTFMGKIRSQRRGMLFGGETVQVIPEHLALTFRPSKQLRERIAEAARKS